MHRIRAGLVLVALAAAAVDHARADIPIGFNSALTGPYAWVGEPHLAGTELAVADINAKGGVLGELLELIVADDGCDAELAPLAAEKLVSEAVAVAFGATCSGAAIPASKVYRRAGTLMIEAGATNPRLTEEGDSRVFRIVGRDDLQGTIGGDYLADRWGSNRIAIVHDDSAFGKGLAEQVKERLNQRGVPEALFATYSPGAMDYSDLLEQLRAASIEVLYLGAIAPRPASSFARRATASTASNSSPGTRFRRESSGWWPARQAKERCSRPSAIPQRTRARPRS